MFKNKSKPCIAWGCLSILVASQSTVDAESLWLQRTPERGFLFYDSKARNIGDSVTVIISQTTDVDNSEDRSMEKSTSAKGTFDVTGSSDGGFGSQSAKAALDLNSTSDRKFDGSSAYSTAQAFTDRMTCTVMDVLPNGNMVVTGERRVRVAGEERTLVATGIIRGLDIGPDNTISSQYISQFHLDYQASGVSQKFTRQGWLGRAVNVVWPW
ncbi:flagellar basal body L-ring protein FlgH [Planctomicrobium piriforme]|uniref:Flagellar L-ring protein FlgH n=1 Tax=Planctomicrobium piriforme TaxID=1576369 RepID=A0A1I3HLG9_9PLAN|nr:flagellar basal body L-ring protein FlgH [Planctomicrobium piriforme]SFI36459.1 flagellar L-ring protein precursor FlgH [Planctomicrobium piriforme]